MFFSRDERSGEGTGRKRRTPAAAPPLPPPYEGEGADCEL